MPRRVSMRLLQFADAIAVDLRHAVRTLARSPGFTTAAIATFALGIGVNVAMLSIIDRMLFRPLPYAEPERLVQIHQLTLEGDSPYAALSRSITVSLAAESRSFSGIAYAAHTDSTLPGPDGSPLRIDYATFNVLDVLGVRPVAGRGFVESDLGGTQTALLISHDVWQARFGGAAAAVGTHWARGRQTLSIVGVLPRGFVLPTSRLGSRPDVLLIDGDLKPGSMDDRRLTAAPVARLRPAVSIEAARAEVEVVAARPSATPFEQPIRVQPLQEGMFMYFLPHLRLISAAGLLVLLIACSNLAGLLLARGRAREHEVAIRSAIGAPRLRLVVGVLMEAALICTASAASALVLSVWIQRAALAVVPEIVQGLAVPVLDPRVVIFTIAAATIATVATALPAALQSRRTRIAPTLQLTGRRVSDSRLLGGGVLLAVEAAIAMVLVAGAAATVRNLAGLLLKDRGFVADDLYVLDVSHDVASNAESNERDWSKGDRRPRVRGILDAVRGLPHLAAAGIVSQIPIDDWGAPADFWKTHGLNGGTWAISNGAVEALGTRLVAGRLLTAEDVEARAPIALLNLTGARALWPVDEPQAAIGRTITVGSSTYAVVGVIGDIRRYPGTAPMPSLFLPISAPEARVFQSSAIVVLRMAPGTTPDRTLVGARLDERFPRASVRAARPVNEMLAPWLERPRFQAALFGVFAAIALLLAAVGLYAVASFNAARRRYEMGIRLTLGATPRAIRRLLIGSALLPVITGSLAGLLITWWAAQFLQTFLFEVDARDPGTYLFVALVLVASAIAAAWLPARRAARTDPAIVLRSM